MKKGFIHIFEIIIIVVSLFVIITQFGAIPPLESDWPEVKLELQANDVLYSLDKMGVNWFDASQVESRLSSVFDGLNVIYNVQLNNVVKPSITLGCICSDAEKSFIENEIARPFSLNGRQIRFSVNKINPNEIVFPFRYDAVVVFDYALLGKDDEIKAFLGAEKGIIQFRHFESEQKVDSVQRDFFGLEWTGIDPGSGTIEFSGSVRDPENLNYNIYKYFFNLPGYSFLEPHTFSNAFSGDKVNVVGGSENIVLLQKNTGIPAAVVNDNVAGGAGRTGWLLRNDKDEDYKQMLRSLIVWAAGDYHATIQNTIKNPVRASLFKVLNQDMYEPMEVVLSLGFVFD